MTRYVKLLSWNLDRGDRWEEGTDWMFSQQPDVVFQQAVRPKDLKADALRLGMTGYTATPKSGSGVDSAVFLPARGPFAFEAEYPQSWAPWHAPTHITVQLREANGTPCPRPVSLVAGHACNWSAEVRQMEAQWCSTLAGPGDLTIHFWDWESYREGEGEGSGGCEDLAYAANRTYLEGGRRTADDRPDRELTAAGYVEMGRYAAEHLARPDAVRLTADRSEPESSPPRRFCVDRGYLSAELAPALVRFEVCDTPQLRRISEHLPLVALLDYDTLRDTLRQPARLHRPSSVLGGPAVDGDWCPGERGLGRR
jgi:hypothetical protein